MNLLGGLLYDPAVAVSKATTALLALTALDTTNLRITFTVPLSGKAYVRVFGGALHGAATYPNILVGILNGATVVARLQPIITVGGTALATTPAQVFAEFIVTGLTPGNSLTWDLAYGVETLVAATGWKYGGPNNTTANDAWGGISYEIWDPSPIYLPAVMPTISLQATDTAIKAKTDSLTFTTALKVDSTIQAAADFAQVAADKVWTTAARSLTDKSNFGINSIAAGTIGTAQFAVGAIDNTVIAANANTAIANAILAAIVEGTLSLKQALQLAAAAAAGKLSGAATATVTIRNKTDTVDAIVATVDSDGNRSAITYTFT